MAKDTKIVTHLNYSELFDSIERNGLLLPFSSLKTVEDFEAQIEYLLKKMNPTELVQFTSFLNMICQTRTSDQTMVRGITFLEETKLVPKGTGFSNRIVFHRENLLNLIGQVLLGDINGTQQLTGEGHLENQQKYCRSILLNNNLLNLEVGSSDASSMESILRDHFIREWPHYYLPDTARLIYGHRIVRYRYCYETLLPSLSPTDKILIEEGVAAFEKKAGVSLEEYMKVISSLYGWFFEIPLQNEKTPPLAGQPKLGFDFTNISSFYIATRLFEKDPSFVKTIDILSKDIDDLRRLATEEAERKRDPISGYNKNVRLFFDNPIFKISEGYYCVIDLKFLIENVCGGLLWRIKNEDSFQNFKSAYGRLMEGYFKFLIQNIFRGAKITFGETEGADAIVEQGDNIFVIEFTTEYYRFASLYNPSSQELVDDAYRLLFNSGKEDPRSRGKNDRGKLLKLNDYIDKNQKEGKTIIPVLVTENMLGNHDLFNAFGDFYNKEVTNNGLTHIKNNPPLFLSLDDLETFWGLFPSEDAAKGFAEFAKHWVPLDKGPQFHNASSGVCRFVEGQRGGEARINNQEFADFFSPKQIYKE